MITESSRFGPRLRWAFALTLAFAFVLSPGARRSFFSGMPLSSRATVLFLALLIVTVFSLLYRPTRMLRLHRLAILSILVAAKFWLAGFLVTDGWRAEYWTPVNWTTSASPLRKARFVTERGISESRTDDAPALSGDLTDLNFLNDSPRPVMETLPAPRDVALPLVVRWRGWPQGPLILTITASGRVRCLVDGHLVFDAGNPIATPLRIDRPEGGVVIEYVKPANVAPNIAVHGIGVRVTATPATSSDVTHSDLARTAIGLLGLLTLVSLALALFDAYPRMSELLLEDVWQEPMKIAALAFFAGAIAVGARVSVPMRRLTEVLILGDDPLGYEGQARVIVRYGLLMTEPGQAEPFHFYPLYSYALACVHRLFGDGTANVVLFNYICMASLGLLAWALLRRYVSTGAGIAALAAIACFQRVFMLDYAATAFTDNLYLPMSLLLVLCCASAMERRSTSMHILTGVVTALAAATRPSALLFVPCFGIWLLFAPDGSGFWNRIRRGSAFGFGFAVGVSPFTLRNWIVSRKFVLLIASFVMLSYFLYPPEAKLPQFAIDVPGSATGRPPNLVESLHQFVDCWRQFPMRTLWTEIRKILFTMGLTEFGPAGMRWVSYLFVIFPILFVLALRSGRIPRHLRNAILIFGASHVIALVVAAPWTYGYKTIVPLHFLFIITSAFLLPNWGERREIEAKPLTLLRSPAHRPLSVVLPTYNEKDSIRAVIDGFFATGLVDEVLVINNNAVEGTSEMVAGSGAVEIFESRQGYGAAIRRGLAEASNELIVVCEPDGTFLPADIEKLLAYSDDFDVVYGSRTSQQLVWRGANMGIFLRWGNWAVAKYLEFAYNATSLTDVGCTMRLVRRDCARAISGRLRIDGSQFGPEMMLETLRGGYRVIQIPVNYMPRVGESAVTGDPAKAFLLGLEMIKLITLRRFEDLAVRPHERFLKEEPHS